MKNKTDIEQRSNEELFDLYKKEKQAIYFGELYLRDIPLLYGLCLKYLGNEADAQDAVMDLYEDVSQKGQKGTLLATYIDMESKEIPLTENVGDIRMKSDNLALSETVVVGYGTQRKRSYTDSAVQKAEANTFGETEFTEYFKKNYDKTICANGPISVKIEFYIGDKGRISNIQIRETSCPALETEIKRLLLGSPAWSNTNRNVVLKLNL